jgi:heme/copper-type cytochrome/quinol oxidase subunit 1
LDDFKKWLIFGIIFAFVFCGITYCISHSVDKELIQSDIVPLVDDKILKIIFSCMYFLSVVPLLFTLYIFCFPSIRGTYPDDLSVGWPRDD